MVTGTPSDRPHTRFPCFSEGIIQTEEPLCPSRSRNTGVVVVKIFAKVPHPQHYYNTGCLDEESLGMDRVAEHGS